MQGTPNLNALSRVYNTLNSTTNTNAEPDLPAKANLAGAVPDPHEVGMVSFAPAQGRCRHAPPNSPAPAGEIVASGTFFQAFQHTASRGDFHSLQGQRSVIVAPNKHRVSRIQQRYEPQQFRAARRGHHRCPMPAVVDGSGCLGPDPPTAPLVEQAGKATWRGRSFEVASTSAMAP